MLASNAIQIYCKQGSKSDQENWLQTKLWKSQKCPFIMLSCLLNLCNGIAWVHLKVLRHIFLSFLFDYGYRPLGNHCGATTFLLTITHWRETLQHVKTILRPIKAHILSIYIYRNHKNHNQILLENRKQLRSCDPGSVGFASRIEQSQSIYTHTKIKHYQMAYFYANAIKKLYSNSKIWNLSTFKGNTGCHFESPVLNINIDLRRYVFYSYKCFFIININIFSLNLSFLSKTFFFCYLIMMFEPA